MVKSPQRRCVVCRRSTNKVELLRFVLVGGKPTWDRLQAAGASGRALYVHPTPGCLSGLGKSGIWQHGFRQKGLVVPAELVEQLVKEIYREMGLKIEDSGSKVRESKVRRSEDRRSADPRGSAPKSVRRKIRI